MSIVIEELKMNAEQVAYFQREYADSKKKMIRSTGAERDQAAAVCAEIEKLAHFLGISQACLHRAVGESTTIH